MVDEVRDETKYIAVEKGLQKACSITIVNLQNQCAFPSQGELSCLGCKYLFGAAVFLFLAVYHMF